MPRKYESELSKLEKAAIALHNVLWQNTGSTDEWPIRIEYTDEKVASKLNAAFNAFSEAIHDLRPELCEWPITREIPGLESWRLEEGEPPDLETT